MSNLKYYSLIARRIIAYNNYDEYMSHGESLGFKSENRVAETIVLNRWWISTVFLNINHCHKITGEPVLFETMIFDREQHKPLLDNNYNDFQYRYTTLDNAELGHLTIIRMTRDNKSVDDIYAALVELTSNPKVKNK